MTDERTPRGSFWAHAGLVSCFWLVAFILLMLFSGCAPVRTGGDPGRAAANQSAAEADAGAQAAKLALGAALTPQLADILDGAGAFSRATLGTDAAPASMWTPATIVADPAGYKKAAVSAERHANGTWNLWALGVAAMAVAPVVLSLLKFVPGVGPVAETAARAAWALLAKRATKDQEAARDQVYAHAATIYNAAMSQLPAPAAATLASAIPAEVRVAILTAPPPEPAL